MRALAIVSPALSDANNGNWQTARRWQRHLAGVCRARIVARWPDGEAATDAALIALHARRSAASIAAWHAARGARGLAVVLTGTDLYRDLAVDATARRALDRCPGARRAAGARAARAAGAGTRQGARHLPVVDRAPGARQVAPSPAGGDGRPPARGEGADDAVRRRAPPRRARRHPARPHGRGARPGAGDRQRGRRRPRHRTTVGSGSSRTRRPVGASSARTCWSTPAASKAVRT